jgi:hypothetical protein
MQPLAATSDGISVPPQINPLCSATTAKNPRSTAIQIGYLRIAADQRWLQTVIRFRARHRAKRFGRGFVGLVPEVV